MDNDSVIAVLNRLIETCKDGQDGFRSAAEAVKDSHLRKIFHEYSMQRAQFIGQLQNEVLRLGGNPETTGSVAAAMHRGWIGLKGAITGGDDGAILAECERGEDSAKDTYKDCLEKEELPADVRTIVQQQYVQVQEAHDTIRGLEVKTSS